MQYQCCPVPAALQSYGQLLIVNHILLRFHPNPSAPCEEVTTGSCASEKPWKVQSFLQGLNLDTRCETADQLPALIQASSCLHKRHSLKCTSLFPRSHLC